MKLLTKKTPEKTPFSDFAKSMKKIRKLSKKVYTQDNIVDVVLPTPPGGRYPSEYKETLKATKLATIHIGLCGRIFGSKSGYHRQFPNHITIFNCNITTAKAKIWYGDVDITLDEQKLKELAKELNETIYLFYEMDARFENETNFSLDRANFSVSPDGTFTVLERYKGLTERCKRGKLKGKLVLNKASRW